MVLMPGVERRYFIEMGKYLLSFYWVEKFNIPNVVHCIQWKGEYESEMEGEANQFG